MAHLLFLIIVVVAILNFGYGRYNTSYSGGGYYGPSWGIIVIILIVALLTGV